jgi:hypothetical protein
MAAATSGLNLKSFQSKLAALTRGDAAPSMPISRGIFSTAMPAAPTNAKAAAFPIVGILLVVTIIVLYSTGRASKETIFSLAGLTLFCLFGGLLYAFMPAGGFSTPAGFNWKGFALMFTAATLSMLVILLIVHYTIRPVFKVKDAGPGMIPVPTVGRDSTGLYWKTSAGSLTSANTILGGTDEGTRNYSLAIDILIKDPNVTSLSDRPIFSRSDEVFTPASVAAEGVSIVQQIGNYNLAMYLDKATNDLIVSTMSAGVDNVFFENVILENVPVQKPFRVGVVMGDKYMEVYYNGKLHSTRQLAGVPLAVAGAFVPPAGNFTIMADVRNLRVWKGAITPAEMAYLPALNIADFGSVTDRSLSPLAGIADSVAGICATGAGVSAGVVADAQANMAGAASLLNNGAGSAGGSSVKPAGGSASAAQIPAAPTPALTPLAFGSSSSANTIVSAAPTTFGSSSSSNGLLVAPPNINTPPIIPTNGSSSSSYAP